MSWADDIRCLHCDGRLPLYRKITNGQFCSTAHRKAYWVEQERLAVERLHQTHSSLRAYHTSHSIESILGPTEPEAVEPAVYEVPQPEDRPAWLTQVNSGEVPLANFIKDSTVPQPRWIEDRLAGTFEPLECENSLRRPVTFYAGSDCGFDFATPIKLEVAAADVLPAEQVLTSISAAWHLETRVPHQVTPETPEFDRISKHAEKDPAPRCETLCSLQPPAPAQSLFIAPTQAAPMLVAMRAQIPPDVLRTQAAPASALRLEAGLCELPVNRIAMAPRPSVDTLRTLEFRAEAPHFDLSTPPRRPRLQLAAGRRYSVHSRETKPAIASPETASLPVMTVSLPQRNIKVQRVTVATSAPAPVQSEIHEPNPTGLLPLVSLSTPSQSALGIHPAPVALSLPQPPRTAPMRPASKLEPIDAKPASDFMSGAPLPAEAAPIAHYVPVPAPLPEHEKAHVWTYAIDFWNRAPRDLKMLVFAIPVLLGLAMHPSLPKVRVAAPAAASGFPRNFQTVVNQRLGHVRKTVLDRAGVALDEDFRAGLDEWVSRGDATTEWSFDSTGFVRPGPLAMYRPSMGLSDYQLQFLGLIDKKALSWVVRAADFDNYYVVKLMVLKSGPLPSIGLTRYAVINGKADSRSDTVVAVDARPDMLYRVRVDVHGNDFALLVQGQMVDSWSEPRLAHGGVGFFAAPGEESRLRWVQVTHQYDMLGRLCAYLAPYNMTSTTGSLQP
jgi:hypothetical protein